MAGSAIHRFLYKWMWDTRCRGADTRRILQPLIGPVTKILDAGCGEYGLSAFMPAANITGADILPVEAVHGSVDYVHGSIIDLPFDDRSFDLAASVDVLEHLPPNIRGDAVKQLMRTSKKTVIITFPAGNIAREIDENFEHELQARGQAIPDWLREHLANPYPVPAEIANMLQDEAKRSGRNVTTKTYYSENAGVARSLRWSAIHSKYLYLAANLLFGILLPIMPKAKAGNAYRTIILAEFDTGQ